MAAQDRSTLKGYFNAGDRPREQEFANLIDSSVNSIDDKTDSNGTIDINNDVTYITPKSAKKIVDKHAVTKVNNVSPDSNGNASVINITGTASSITGNIAKNQVTGLQADLDGKVNSNNLKTINGQSLIGNTDIAIGAPVKLIAIPISANIIPAGTTAANAFPASCDTFTLQANKTYSFRGKYLLTNGVAHTVAMSWTATGLVITSMEYAVRSFSAATNSAVGSARFIQISGNVMRTVLGDTGVIPNSTIEFEGILRCTTGGTLVPRITFSANTVNSSINIGSFIEFTEVGSNIVEAIGAVG